METLRKSIYEPAITEKRASFELDGTIEELKHYLPAQAPLKDFVHHNTLHAFQNLNFTDAIKKASVMFGYRVSLSLDEYRSFYKSKKIRKDILEKIIEERKGFENKDEWLYKVLTQKYERSGSPRIGAIRAEWKKQYKIDLDSRVHPVLFRVLGSYLDQGISIWRLPVWNKGFLSSIRELEQNTYSSLFKTKRARNLLLNSDCEIEKLLKIIVGEEALFKQYLFDQQFAHPGWSGIVSVIEDQPETLLDSRKISLKEIIAFELLLEIDALDLVTGKNWTAISNGIITKPVDLFSEVPKTELDEVLNIWQNALEWSYYDEVLAGLVADKPQSRSLTGKSFQALFCIDDRETSLRDYLEKFDPNCESFSTPGFFNTEFFFQPENGKFYTKQCPATVTPMYLIKETGKKEQRKTDAHFSKHSHSLLGGWIITQTLGYWSAFKLFLNIFSPSGSPATSSSFQHMDKSANLIIENTDPAQKENRLQVGFTIEEMTERVAGLLNSIGLIKDFAPVIYVIGHGASSVNNPHYAAYDCGACAGRPGSVNARVFAFMANNLKVRALLKEEGIDIPDSSQFLGGLHDTTTDDICFYDEDVLNDINFEKHKKNVEVFRKALTANAKERSRRFESIDTQKSGQKIHEKIRKRAISLFEPRPELNHATNTLCIVGRRELTKNVFLDRRAFLNSYDYKVDPEGKYLQKILKAATPVCGGINLEYYFSRVDNQKFGAGSKLPHNVIGLFGVANGTEGDLRSGLPSQMIEIHDPLRLLMIVEHFPDTVLEVIKQLPELYEWFENEWEHLAVIHPETKDLFVYWNGGFTKYMPLLKSVSTTSDITPLIEKNKENIPVHIIA